MRGLIGEPCYKPVLNSGSRCHAPARREGGGTEAMKVGDIRVEIGDGQIREFEPVELESR